MKPTVAIAPVRKVVTVDASREHAFKVFTAGIGKWWPAQYSIGSAPQKTAVMEERAGGRWYEVGEDGGECEWGRVLVWEPPSRVILAWQISTQWQFDPDIVTEVEEVRFTEQSDGKTTVEFEHRNLEQLGAEAESFRATFDSPDGWAGLLELYRQAA